MTGVVPRDLDLWPLSTGDLTALTHHFDSHPHARRIHDSLFNIQYEVSVPTLTKIAPATTTAPVTFASATTAAAAPASVVNVQVEVVKKCHASLSAILAGFDLALSAAGVYVVANRSAGNGAWQLSVKEVLSHADWVQSLLFRQPLLLQPLANAPFVLATAERVLRYAQELKFPHPKAQLQQLQECFSHQLKLNPLAQTKLLRNYEITSHGGKLQTEVSSLFKLAELQPAASSASAQK